MNYLTLCDTTYRLASFYELPVTPEEKHISIASPKVRMTYQFDT